jgi:hypothetical protein
MKHRLKMSHNNAMPRSNCQPPKATGQRRVRISVFGQVEVAVMGEKQMPATIAPKGF